MRLFLDSDDLAYLAVAALFVVTGFLLVRRYGRRTWWLSMGIFMLGFLFAGIVFFDDPSTVAASSTRIYYLDSGRVWSFPINGIYRMEVETLCGIGCAYFHEFFAEHQSVKITQVAYRIKPDSISNLAEFIAERANLSGPNRVEKPVGYIFVWHR